MPSLKVRVLDHDKIVPSQTDVFKYQGLRKSLVCLYRTPHMLCCIHYNKGV